MTRRSLTVAWGAPLLMLLALAAAPRATAASSLAFTACPGQPSIGCAHLAVPLDAGDPSGDQISLSVQRILAGPAPSQDAVVALAGGPGQAATPLTQSFAQEMAPALKTRDLIVFDQRGTGDSTPLSCAALSLNEPIDQDAAMCALQIGSARADFTTANSVDDIEGIRQAGGYSKLVLFGTSYGTKVALEYAERYPQNVEALVLDSTVLVTGPDPLSRSSFPAIPTALRDLCSDGACSAVGAGNPVGDIAALVKRMETAPLKGHVYDGFGRREPFQMQAPDLFDLLVAGDLNPALRAELPAALHAALGGDPASLLRLDALGAGLLPDSARGGLSDRAPDVGAAGVPRQAAGSGFDQALYTNTVCEEGPFPWTPRDAGPASRIAQAEATARSLPASIVYPFDQATALVSGNIPMCVAWPVASPPPPADGPLPDVPTLILSGEDDLRTPTSDARQLAARIPGAQLLVVPHTGHSVLGSDLSSCSGNAVTAFFAGQAIKPCGTVPNQFPPTPIPPTRLSHVTPAPGVSNAHAARTMAAVQDTVVDLRREIIGAVLNSGQGLPPGARFGGLRSGDAAYTGTAVVLHSFSYVPGVTLSGTIPTALIGFDKGRSATLTIAGRTAAQGQVTLESGERARGRLGGHRFSVTVAILSADTTGWPWNPGTGRPVFG